MNNHWNTRIPIFFIISLLLHITGINGSVFINHQAPKLVTASELIMPPKSQQAIPIPADGNALYKSIMVGYLLPVVNNAHFFNARVARLIGEALIIPKEEINDDNKDDSKVEFHQVWDPAQIRQKFLSLRFSNLVYCLQQYPFSQLVLYMKSHIGIKDKMDRNSLLLQKIADKLQVTIEEYTPHAKDKNRFALPIRIQPKQKKNSLTLRIVKDHPSKEEIINEFSNSQVHYWHYRALLDQIETDRLEGKMEKLNLLAINCKNNMGLPYTQEELTKGRFISCKEKVKLIKEEFGNLPKQEEESKVICLVAAAGMGKTTLAELYADDSYKKGRYKLIWRIHMEEEVSQNCNIFEIFSELGIGEAYSYLPSDKERKNYLKNNLEKYPGWLLILDHVGKNIEEIKEYLKMKGGHILITTRYQLKLDKLSQSLSYFPLYQDQGNHSLRFNKSEGVALLTHFHQPSDLDENKSAAHIVKKTQGWPLAIAMVGYYIANNKSDTIYSEYLKKLNSSQIKEPIKKIFDITQAKLSQLPDTLRILRVMTYFNSDGVAIGFLKYLRPSRKEYYIKGDWWVQDANKSINFQQAQRAWKRLREYGMVGQAKSIFKIDRSLQGIIRKEMIAQKITPYIADQAVQLLERINQEKREKPLLMKLNMLRHIHSVMGYTGKNVVSRCRLLSLVSQIEHPDLVAKGFYLPPLTTNGKGLDVQVDTFLHETKKKLMLITAGTGSGKKAYAAYLLQKTWKDYYKSWGWKRYPYIPLLISLPAICRNKKLAKEEITFDLVAHALAQKGLKEEAIDELRNRVAKRKEHLLLILDSFDEITPAINANTKNIYQKYALDKWFSSSTKAVITCRSSELKDRDTSLLFACKGVPHHEVTIAPFAKGQIDQYTDEFAASSYNRVGWKSAKYHHALAQFPKLKKIIDYPLMLVVVLRVLPTICEKNLQEVTLHTVYELFTQQWLRRVKEKNPHVKEIDKKLRSFCEELAFKMFLEGKYCMKKKEDKKQDLFLQQAATFQASPLREIKKGVYEFLQPSYRDFFAAPLIMKKKALRNHINSQKINDQLILFLKKEIGKNEDDALEKTLWEYVNQARKEKGMGKVAADCLQLLTAINPENLKDRDLSGIDLQGGNLTGLNLSGANLTGVNFTGCQFSWQ